LADLDPAVKAALERTKQGRVEHEGRLRRFDHAYDVYNASPSRVGVEPWQSKLRVKWAKQTIDTATVNIVSGVPRCQVRPRQPGGELPAKAMQHIMDYYVGEDHLVEKQPVIAQQGLVYGITPAKIHWLYSTTKRPTKRFTRNPFDQSQPLEITDIDEQIVVVRDGPTLEPWSPYHVYWEPGARDVDSAAYVVLQTYLSKEDLRKLKFNPDTGIGIYHNVDDLISRGPIGQSHQTSQDRALGNNERFKDKYLIEEFWTDDTLVVIGNRQVLLRAQDNPYWHGKKPIVIAQTSPDLYEMVGSSETELIDHIQQAAWTLQNMTMDNLHLTVMRGITYREGGVTDPSQLELRPRFKWPVSDHDDIRPFEVQPISSDVFTERQRLMTDMQQVTGINPYVTGAGDTAGVDQNTATGITALQEVASRLLRFKAAQIQYKVYQRNFEQWGDLIQQFMDKSIPVKLMGPGNEGQWVEISPSMVAGHFNYDLEGTEESLSKQQERGEAIALLNAFAPLVPTGMVNIKPLLEKVATAYNFPNPEALVAPAQPAQPPAAPVAGQLPQQPTGGTNVQALLGGQTLDPRIQNAITNGSR